MVAHVAALHFTCGPQGPCQGGPVTCNLCNPDEGEALGGLDAIQTSRGVSLIRVGD